MLRRVKSETELRAEARLHVHRSLQTRRQSSYLHFSNVRTEPTFNGRQPIRSSYYENETSSPAGALSPRSRSSVTSASSYSPTSPKSAPVKRNSGDFLFFLPSARKDIVISEVPAAKPVETHRRQHASHGSKHVQYEAARSQNVQQHRKTLKKEDRPLKTVKDLNSNNINSVISHPVTEKSLRSFENTSSVEDEALRPASRISQATMSNLEDTVPEEVGRKVIHWLRGLDEDASRRYARKQMAGISQTNS